MDHIYVKAITCWKIRWLGESSASQQPGNPKHPYSYPDDFMNTELLPKVQPVGEKAKRTMQCLQTVALPITDLDGRYYLLKAGPANKASCHFDFFKECGTFMVICMRDGKLCLLFRVGDMRKSSLAEAHVRLQILRRPRSEHQMIKRCVTYEGELLPFHQFDMDVGYENKNKNYYFNSTTGTCEPFFYGGCGGTKNNFKRLNKCIKVCKAD
ncbi:Kunitz/Bovine pancreatic trypsin inhibitor domain protein [Ancylostoma duodenale]|uniref:Kunitz/Bovine pancreatic trypsin inhibitor domain protein n=1 Tax=Ancylostoma duodenale TaxID=51022 RepID=A0A0C2GGG7_9BILA|nr:Kunitz/Bovine pancreatic trypsin inhibitor domain protein [Ancylostoma duodenale]